MARSRYSIRRRAQSVERNHLADIDILTPNGSEARILLGLPPDNPSPPLELAQRLLEMGVGKVVVTLGGVEASHVPAIPIQAVDVTGAGDSFNAALAVSLGEGLALEEAVHVAVRAGAYAALRLGVIDGLPTRAQLEKFALDN